MTEYVYFIKASCTLLKQRGTLKKKKRYGFDFTCVCVLAYLSSELFHAGQFDDSSVGCGRGGDIHIFILVLVFPGSFSVSQHKRHNFSHARSLMRFSGKLRSLHVSAARGQKCCRNEGDVLNRIHLKLSEINLTLSLAVRKNI